MKKMPLLLAQVLIITLNFSCKGSLEEKRINKLNQVVYALKSGNSATLESLLNSDEQEIKKKEMTLLRDVWEMKHLSKTFQKEVKGLLCVIHFTMQGIKRRNIQ